MSDQWESGSSSASEWYNPPHPEEYSYTPGYGFLQKPPHIMEQQALRRYATGLATAVFAYLVLASLLPSLLRTLFSVTLASGTPTQATGPLHYVISALSFALALGLPFGVYGFAIGIPRGVAMPTAKRPTASFIIPALMVAMGLSVISKLFITQLATGLRLIGIEAVITDIDIPTSPIAFMLCTFNLTLLPAIVEEFVMRGIVMQSLRRFGDSFALVVSSLFFALLHQNILQYPNALLMGLFIGYCVLYTGSIWAGVAIHVANNAMVWLLILWDRLFGMSDNTSLMVHGLLLVGAFVSLAFWVRHVEGIFHIPPSRAFNATRVLVKLFYSTPAVWVALFLMVAMALQSVRVIG